MVGEMRRGMTKVGVWLLSAIGVLVIWLLCFWAGAKWSEAIVQGAAAIGGLLYWDHSTRSRVTLRILSSDGLYLEFVNVGNRVAKDVKVRCVPPIPWEANWTTPGAEFGDMDFGDMDRNQQYVILISSPTPESADQLEKTTFEVSHETGIWGFRRRKSTIRVRGSGWRASVEEGAATPIGEIADTVKKQERQLMEIREAIATVGHRLLPPIGKIADTVKKQEHQLMEIREAIATVGHRLSPPEEKSDT